MPWRADIDPRARRHLAVHHQALAIELVEMLPGRPVRHQIGVGDQHARRIRMRAEHADRLAGLHQQRLILLQPAQRLDDAVEAFPVARGAADAAIDHQLLRPLRDHRVEIVHQHPQRRFGQPGFGGEFRAVRRADDAGVVETGHGQKSFEDGFQSRQNGEAQGWQAVGPVLRRWRAARPYSRGRRVPSGWRARRLLGCRNAA